MNKKTLVLGVVLIVLIILAYVYQGPLKKWQTNLGKADNFFAKVNIDDIKKVEIFDNGVLTVLNNEEGKWRIGGTKDFFLSAEMQDRFENGLKDLALANLELISTNQDKQNEFRTDDSGVKVKIVQDKGEIDFVVGKLGSDYASTYIAKVGAPNTYSVKVDLFGIFNNSEWRDKTIFSSDKTKITKIRFQYPGREFTVEKIDNVWVGTAPYKFSVGEEKINPIVDIMSDLEATSIPVQNFAGTDLEKNLIIVQVTGEGVDNTIMVGKDNGDGLYYAKRGNSDNIYLTTKEQRDNLLKQIWQLK